MNYTLHQLQIFVKVCELQSITKASEELFLTQPAVSIQLKKLQDQFEIPLTEVIGRQLYITDFGRKIEEASRRLLGEAEGITNTVNEYKGLLTGDITISSASTGKYVIPYFLSDFASKYPGVNITIDVTNKSRVVQSLEQNKTDFALVSVLPEHIAVKRMELMENELLLVAGKASQLSTKKPLQPKDLSELPMIFREKGSATRGAMENYLEKLGVEVQSRLELVSNEAVKQAVIANLGYSIMPRIGMRTELEIGKLINIPAKGLPIKTHWNLIYNESKILSPACNALLDHIAQHKDEIIKTHFDSVK